MKLAIRSNPLDITKGGIKSAQMLLVPPFLKEILESNEGQVVISYIKITDSCVSKLLNYRIFQTFTSIIFMAYS